MQTTRVEKTTFPNYMQLSLQPTFSNSCRCQSWTLSLTDLEAWLDCGQSIYHPVNRHRNQWGLFTLSKAIRRRLHLLLGEVWKYRISSMKKLCHFCIFLLVLGGSSNFSEIKNYKPQNINKKKDLERSVPFISILLFNLKQSFQHFFYSNVSCTLRNQSEVLH